MDSSKDMIRSFICVELPDNIKRAVERHLDGLNLNRMRKVPKQNMHITLLFLGNLDQNRIDMVKEVLQSISSERFTLSIKGFGSFSSKSHVVLFAKVEDGSKALTNMQAAIFNQLKNEIHLDNKNYVPHFTVARIADLTEKEEINRFIATNSGKEFGGFTVNEMILKKSMLTENGPVHSDIYSKKLNTARIV